MTTHLAQAVRAAARLALSMAAVLVMAGGASAAPLRVVATLSTFAELVKQIGGDAVEVSYVAPPRFNPHFIEPRPSDVMKVKKADLLVHGGLDLEAWRGPLLDAAGNPRVFPGQPGELDLSRGIALLEIPDQPLSRVMEDIHLYGNPHYWTNPENARIMAQAICDRLCEADPAHEPAFRRRLQTFLARLDRKIPEWRAAVAPYRGQEVVAYHNEWPYFAQFVGLKVEQFLEPKPGIPPTPRHLEFLEQYLTTRGIRAIIQPSYQPAASSQVLAQRTGATVVILAQNVGELPGTEDYFSWVDDNIRRLVEALGGPHD